MPRIRTIKPEFWTHPVLSRLPDSARLLAIALLNYADDEGYFFADERLIRNFVWPFTDSSVMTHGALTELSNIGFIQVAESKGNGKIGRVVKFSTHQVINRAKPSKIKDYATFSDESVIDHGLFTDDSSLEGKGREGNVREGKGKTQAASRRVFVPPTLDQVRAYCQERKNQVNPEAWMDYHTARGWKYKSGQPMVDWKGAVRTWEHNNFSNGSNGNGQLVRSERPQQSRPTVQQQRWANNLERIAEAFPEVAADISANGSKQAPRISAAHGRVLEGEIKKLH